MTQLAVFNDQAIALAGPGRFDKAAVWGESSQGRADYISTDKGMFGAVIGGTLQGARVPFIEGVIVGQFPQGRDTGRTYFEGTYNPGATTIPACHSADGKHPSDDSKSPQHHSCNGCPKNAAGSGATPGSRACRFNKTLAVAVPAVGDKVFALKISAQAIFAKKDEGGNYGLNAFEAALGSMVPQEVQVVLSQPEGSTGGVRIKPTGVFDLETATHYVNLSGLQTTKDVIEEPATTLNPDLVARFSGGFGAPQAAQAAVAQPPAAAGGFGAGAQIPAQAPVQAPAQAPAPAQAQAQAPAPAPAPAPAQAGGFGTPGGFGTAADVPKVTKETPPDVASVAVPTKQVADATGAGTPYNAALSAAFGM